MEEQLEAALKEVIHLQEVVAVKDERITSLDATITTQVAAIEKLDATVKDLENQLAWLRKKVFGKMSEKRLPLDPNQLDLFAGNQVMSGEEKAELAKMVEESDGEITKMIAVKSKPSRRPLDTTRLPVEVEDIYPEGTLGEDGRLRDEYVEIGTEDTTRLERIPAKIYIVRTVRHKVIRKSDIKDKYPEERNILVAALPLAPVNKCIAGASVLADIITGKFLYHLPFYRQIQQYREAGITVSDSTMGGWYEAAVEKLKLLYDLLRKQILSSEYIQIDESVVPVIDNEKHRTRKGYEWCVRDAVTGDVMFYYDRGSRGSHVARDLLGGSAGVCRVTAMRPTTSLRRWKESHCMAVGRMQEENIVMPWKKTDPWRQRPSVTSASSTRWKRKPARPVLLLNSDAKKDKRNPIRLSLLLKNG